MPLHTAEMIRLLETELDIIESGGYGRSVREPWKPKSIFEYSVACINHWLIPEHAPQTCDDCILLDFVPDEFKNEPTPCHYIPLNEAGETVASLEQEGDQDRLETVVKGWLRETIKRLKEELAESGEAGLKPSGMTY